MGNDASLPEEEDPHKIKKIRKKKKPRASPRKQPVERTVREEEPRPLPSPVNVQTEEVAPPLTKFTLEEPPTKEKKQEEPTKVWDLLVDPESGRRYWHHVPSGHTQWVVESAPAKVKRSPVHSEPLDDAETVFMPRWQREAAKAKSRKSKTGEDRPRQPSARVASTSNVHRSARNVVFGEPKDDYEYPTAPRQQSPPPPRTKPVQLDTPPSVVPPQSPEQDVEEISPNEEEDFFSPQPSSPPRKEEGSASKERKKKPVVLAPWLDGDMMRRRSEMVQGKEKKGDEDTRELTKRLVDSIRQEYGDETCAEFQIKAREFGHGTIDARFYVDYLESTFGRERTSRVVIPVLVELLSSSEDLRRRLLEECSSSASS